MAGFATDAVLFEIETATPGTYAAVAQQMNVKPPAYKRKTIEVPIAGTDYPVQMFGNIESMDVTLDLLFDPDTAGQTDLFTLFGTKAKKNYRISYPDPTPRKATFEAVVIGWEEGDMPADAKELTASVTFRLTAKPTIT